MTGVFFVRKKGSKTLLTYKGSGPRGGLQPYFEAYDFLVNRSLLDMLYKVIAEMKTGETLEIVCELEE